MSIKTWSIHVLILYERMYFALTHMGVTANKLKKYIYNCVNNKGLFIY
jgi:hypothetical protein